ncbi:hypothetical protein BOX15_Mlig003885g1, partial [Macrostomum lignano]
KFEQSDQLLPQCWLVVRVDGRGFHKFSERHEFAKPNEPRCIRLMTLAARRVLMEHRSILLAYGQSDEYSFVLHKDTNAFNRRASKLASLIGSLFTSAFVFNWSICFPDRRLLYPPAFDARAVAYPSVRTLRDYLSWRQADCHINNLYNTAFWSLVLRGGLSANQAQERLKGTLAADKNELLFSQFGINYNNEPEVYRKGSLLVRASLLDSQVDAVAEEASVGDNVPDVGEASVEEVSEIAAKVAKAEAESASTLLHIDIIKDKFWTENPRILPLDSQ